MTIKLYGLSDCSGLLDGAFELAQRLSGMLDCHGSGELAQLNGSGGAEVSEKHAGFIVNMGGATEADVRALVAEIRRRVLLDTGVQLERELKYWDEV